VLEALEVAGRELTSVQQARAIVPFEFPAWLPARRPSDEDRDSFKRRWELFLRFVFSALVDADFLDTEAHFDRQRSRARSSTGSIEDLWEQYQERRRRKLSDAPPTKPNQARNEIYDHSLAAAERPPGLFRLTVPTGGGKTLSGMAFALRHALAHDLRRVIIAIPYTSIIEQTAEEYRNLFGDAACCRSQAVFRDLQRGRRDRRARALLRSPCAGDLRGAGHP